MLALMFFVDTNLPPHTSLMLTLTQDDFRAQDTVTIRRSSIEGRCNTASSTFFSNRGEPLSGTYTLVVSMSVPRLQDERVRAVIGEYGEYLLGSLVYFTDIEEVNVVRAEFEFTF